MGTSTQIHKLLAWSPNHGLLSTLMNRPILRPMASPTPSAMRSKGTPRTYIQKRAWVNFRFASVIPSSQRRSRRR